MEFINLPDDVLVYLFKNFLNLNDLLVLSTTCKKLSEICNNYKMWSYFKTFYPIMDYSYPYGYDKHRYFYTNLGKIEEYFKTGCT